MTKPESQPKEVSSDDLYRRSTQFEVWSYTTESFQITKQKANESGRTKAAHNFDTTLKKLAQEDPAVFEQFKDDLSTSLLDLLTYEEEAKYLNFYSKNIVQTCNHFKMPTQVKATAVSFFKKFYMVNSVMEFHPKNVLYTCVFLAAKSENYFISIDSFVKALRNTNPKDILDLEFIVLHSLKFTLMVHHPFRPLYGFFLDFQAVLLHPTPLMYDVSVDTLGSLYDRAKTWLNTYALLSDVAFLFTPPQIALAAMYDTDKRITDRYLKKKFLRTEEEKQEDIKKETEIKKEATKEVNKTVVKQEPGVKLEPGVEVEPEEPEKDAHRLQYETLVKTIRKCIKIAKQVPETSREESTSIDKKCYFALNPKRLIEKKKNKLLSPSPENPESV